MHCNCAKSCHPAAFTTVVLIIALATSGCDSSNRSDHGVAVDTSGGTYVASTETGANTLFGNLDAAAPDSCTASAEGCVDERECKQVQAYQDLVGAEVALDALCKDCPLTLDAAIAQSSCAKMSSSCGRVQLSSQDPGAIFVYPVYDMETGVLVGAQASTNEYIKRSVDGCCAVAFTAGQVLERTCGDLVVSNCAVTSDEDGGI